MMARLIVAAVGIAILLPVVFLCPLWVFAIFIGAICALCVREFLRCAAPEFPLRMRIVGMVLAGIVPFAGAFGGHNAVTAAAIMLSLLYLAAEVVLSFQREEPFSLQGILAYVFSVAFIPLMLGALVRVGTAGEWFRARLLLPFLIAFTCDSGAYFVGIAFGKHKLTPKLSPNKSLEGYIGGFLTGIVCALLYGVVLHLCGVEVRFVVLMIYGFLGSFACELGDLFFSAVKRLCDVKDFGHLIPGHNGVMDRFDSLVFVAPLVEVLLLWVPAIL